MKKVSLAIACLAMAGFAGEYGMAGCGLGAIVMGKKGNQVLAATTNGTLYSQSFGITSGISNCTDDGVALKDREKEAFTEANFESLKQELAQGQGENVLALATLYGCDEQGAASFSSEMHQNYQSIASDSPAAMLESIDAIQQQNGVCQN